MVYGMINFINLHLFLNLRKKINNISHYRLIRFLFFENGRNPLYPLLLKSVMTKVSMKLAIISVAFLMLVTGAVYLFVATQEIAEANEVHEEELSESIKGALIETILFSTVGGAYVPVGLWAISTRQSSKTPYYLAVIGSGALILLYVLSRTIDLPLVGIQDDIGFIDISAKVLQAPIIGA